MVIANESEIVILDSLLFSYPMHIRSHHLLNQTWDIKKSSKIASIVNSSKEFGLKQA